MTIAMTMNVDRMVKWLDAVPHAVERNPEGFTAALLQISWALL